MRIKLTKKVIKDNFSKIYFGDFPTLLIFLDRVGYACGVYGWNYDCYSIAPGVAFLTGNRGMFGEHIPYDITSRYDNMYKEWLDNNTMKDYTEKRNKALELLEQLVRELNKDK